MACAVVLSVAGAHLVDAEVAQVELHSFETRTLTDRQFLTGEGEGETTTITGELRLPMLGGGRLPAVIVVHGSDGVSGYVADWADYLNGLGVATFMLDSFTGRGFSSVVDDQPKLGRLTMIVDAYRALERLARHPRIDPSRIAIMGFSRGGQAALYASVQRFRRLHGPRDGAGFAAYLAFYPPCNTAYAQDDVVADAPIRLFHGAEDDFNRVEACEAYMARLRAAGADARLTQYAGAAHVFDWPMLAQPLTLEGATTTRNCRMSEGAGGQVINTATGKPFGYGDACVERGPTLAYDAQAFAAAKRAVADIVTRVLRPDSSGQQPASLSSRQPGRG